MEPLRGVGCQFWVEMAPAQNVTDCSEGGFHQPDFGVGSRLPRVLCSFQNKNPVSEQPWRLQGQGKISARLCHKCLIKDEGPR